MESKETFPLTSSKPEMGFVEGEKVAWKTLTYVLYTTTTTTTTTETTKTIKIRSIIKEVKRLLGHWQWVKRLKRRENVILAVFPMDLFITLSRVITIPSKMIVNGGKIRRRVQQQRRILV